MNNISGGNKIQENTGRRSGALRRHLSAAWLGLCLSGLLAGSAAAVTLVQDFYLPMPEAQVYQAESAIKSGITNTQYSIYAIVVTGNGTQIFYDQWEDGYEVNLASPVQASTQVWGDGNNANGIAPGFVNDPNGLPAGTVITLTNNVPLPRNPSVQLYDARDRVAATKALAITRAGWPVTPGSVFAGAVSVLSTIDYGTNYISPVGQDLTNNLFQYVGLFVMAGQDGTAVTIDTDGNTGPTAPFTITLNRGESYLVNGGIKKGASVVATKNVQAHMIIGHVGASYAADWFTLYPVEQWSSSYYTPVSSAASGAQPTYVYLYNPNTNALTIAYNTRVGSGSFSIPASNGVFQYQMPIGSGASFTSAGGARFYALATVAANNAADTAYNWGFTLLPSDALTTEASVGWAPGSSDLSVNGSPVWVTPVANTTIYVDYNGDRNGPFTIAGQKYDTNYTVAALESKKIFDPDKDQTAMRLFTVDGTLISTAWGQDPGTAAPGNPYIDAGTVVIPFPVPTLRKTLAIVTDLAPSGLSTNDVIEYTVTLDNKGLLPLGNTVVIDAPSANLAYVNNSTTLDGNPITDDFIGSTRFPLDESGYTIPVILRGGTSTFKYRYTVTAAGVVSNSVNVGGTTLTATTTLSPGVSNQCAINFTDSGGVVQPAYTAGANVFVTVTDNDVNTSSNSVQTTSVVVRNPARGDLETITLTETGTNTGVFRNLAGLPTSISAGLGQQDGTLYIVPGDTLTVTNVDAVFGDTCSASAVIQVPASGKVLYLSDPSQALDRIDPVATGDNTTATSIDIGQGGGGTFVTNAPGVDGSFSTNGTSSPLNFNYTAGSGTNRLVLVAVALVNSGGAPVASTPTYGGVSMSLVSSSIQAGGGSTKLATYVYALTNPPTGSSAVSVGWTTGNSCVAGVNSFTNVNLSGPFSSTNATGTSGGTSITVSSATNQLVYAAIGSTAAQSLAGGQSAVVRWTNSSAATIFGMGNTVVGSNSPTTSITWQQTGFAVGVSLNPSATFVPSGGGGPATNVTSFTQTPTFASNFIISSNNTIAITNFITLTNGTLSGTPAVTATLRYGSTNIITMSNPTYTAASNRLVWQGSLPANVTIPTGAAITLDVSNGVPNTAFRVDYDSITKPSKIILPTSTVIAISSFGVYDAPYPGGSLVTTPVVGSTLYVRAVVTDPFGNYDISSVKFAITAPSPSADLTVTNTVPVATNAASATYEYVWNTSSTAGGYSLVATANEGSEGITATAATSLTLIVLDLGTPSTASFVSNTYPANATVCFTVTDLDQNLTNTAVETLTATVTSPSGDSELVTLTETGTNTGVFTACLNTSTNSGSGNNNSLLLAPVGSVLTLTYTDPNDPADISTATTTIIPPPGTPGMAVTKSIVTPANGQALVGDSVQFNLAVANTGSTILTNVSLVDAFPASRLTYSSATPTPTTVTSSNLTWALGNLPVGASTNLTVNFTAAASGAATNFATITSTSATNSSSARITNTSPALTVTKTLLSPTNSPVSIGTNVIFRLVIRNSGDVAIPTLPLEDTFSAAYLQYTNATIAPDGVGAGSLFWANLPGTNGLAVGASITNDITMRVVGAGNPAQNLAAVNYAVDANGKPVPPASSLNTNLITAAATISGRVINDTNQSGTLNVGEVGLADVTLSLFSDPNGDGDPADGALVQLVTSDANGYYELLNLPLGKYVVVETDPAGFSSSFPVNNRLALNLTNFVNTAANTNANFFDYQPAPITYGSIAGTVYYDLDGNGTLSGGDTGLAGVNLDLIQDANTNGLADVGEPVIASTTSGTNGAYAFAALTIGNYVIRETDLTGYYSTGDTGGTNDNQIGVTITAGLNTTNRSFFDRPLPLAVNDTNSAPRNIATTLTPLINDTNYNGDTLTITNAVSTNGVVVNNLTNLTFTATNLGTSYITYTISDGHGGTSTATITVTVTNLPPIAVNDTTNTLQNVPVTIFPLGNDSDPNGDPISITVVNPTNGTISSLTASNFVFTPATNFIGTATIGYTISDGNGGTSNALITVTVRGLPVANPDNFSTPKNVALTIAPLGNDTDPNPSAIAIASLSPTNGTVSAVTSSNFLFTPTSNFTGTAYIGYTITNIYGGSATSLITVTVTNRPPVANNDSASGTQGVAQVITPLGNDSDPDSDTITITAATSTNGIVVINPGNTSLTFTPTNNGTAYISYTISDGSATASAVITVTVAASADVSVTKSAASSVTAGQNLTYTITVTNAGPSVATNVIASDALPAGVSVFSLGGGVSNNGVVTWPSIATLASGASSNYTLIVTAPANATTLTNFASVTNSTPEPTLTNNLTPPVITVVNASADVSVTKSAASSVTAGQNLTYTITVTNAGPSTATNVIASDALPAGVSVFSLGGGVSNNGVVTWPSIATLASGASSNYTLIVTAPANATTLTNFAAVTNSTPEPTLTNNITPPVITTVNASADVSVTKSAAGSVTAGANLTYTITVTNAGPSVATNVIASDSLPAGVSVFSLGGGVSNNGVVTWPSIATLASGASSNYTLIIVAPASGTLTNYAAVTNSTPDPTPTNNLTPPVITTIGASADVSITKSAATNVLAGANLTYTIIVTNAGPSVATNVVVTDSLPTGAVFVSASNSGTTNGSGGVTWPAISTLASGAASSYTLIVTAPANGILSLTNVASFTTPTPDPTPTNNTTPPVITTVTPSADVRLGKTGPAGASNRVSFSYSITVTNFGPSTATSLSVTDSLPAGLVFVSAVPAATTNGSQVVWTNLGDFALNATTNLTLTVVSTGTGSVTNFASGGSPVSDPNPTNNVGGPVVTAITNIPPVAVNDAYTAAEDTLLTVPAGSGILTNDFDANGDALTIQLVSTTTNGVLTLNTNTGGFTYLSATNFFGTDTFTYRVSDGVSLSGVAVVTITITNINDAPVAFPQTLTNGEDLPLSITLTGSDVDGPVTNFTVLTQPLNGTVTGTAPNVTFQPATNWFGTTSFTFSVCDGFLCATNTITIIVTNINDAPVAVNDNATTPQNTPVTVNVLTNDFDVDLDPLTLTTNLLGVTNGTVNIVGTNVLYSPATNFYGTNVFRYVITDGSLFATGTVTVVVSPVATTASALTSLVVCPAQSATFSTVAGGSGPFSYAWRKAGVLQGSTSNSLTIASATAVDAGTYSVEVTGFLNTVTNTATLTVNTNVAITSAPTNQTNLCLASTANFSVGATGTGLAYQWYFGTNLLAGATNSALAVSNVNAGAAGVYRVVVSGTCNSVTNSAVLALDSQAPVSSCPADITVNAAPGLCGSNVVYSISASDNCGVAATNLLAGLASGSLFPVGTTTNTYSFVDAVGNSNVCSFTVTVVDNQAPQFTCPATIVRTNDVGQCGATFSLAPLVATDNCGSVTVTSNAPATFSVGTNLVTWTVVDSHNNTNTCTQSVIITDVEKPVITTPVNITVNAAAGSCASNVTFTVTATDNCGTPSVSSVPASGSSFPVGTTTVTNTVTDTHGNTNTSTFTVTVVDNQAPQFTCPATVTRTNDLGQCGATFSLAPLVATDNCGSVTVTSNAPATFNVGTNLVTWTVVDSHNNTNTCVQSVIITDVEKPVINTPANISVNAAPGACSSNVTFSVTATDNCGGVTVTSAPASGSSFPVGTTTVTNTVSDTHGNTNTSTFTVTVVDNQLPTIACPSNLLVVANSGYTATNVSLGTPTVGDNCGTPTVTNNAPTVYSLGTNFVTWTATDLHGNTNFCTQQIIVWYSNRPPVAVNDSNATPRNVAVTLDPRVNDTDPETNALTIVSVSGTNGVPVINGGTNVTFTPTTNFQGVATIGYTISDGQGGTNSAVIYITVTNRPPVALNDTTNTLKNVSVVIRPLGNDSDPDGDALTIVSFAATNGSAVIVGGTNLLFLPSTNFTGTAYVGYTISDGYGGTNSAVIAITVTGTYTPMADIAVFKFGPATATVSNSLVYTIIVTNQGPDTATNAVLTDYLPTNTVFLSAAPSGTYSNASRTYTWPLVARLASGATTNYTITLATTNTGVISNALTVTNVASAFSVTYDPNLTNNNGSLPASKAQTVIYPVAVAVQTAAPVYNPQISLYEESVTVTNFGQATILGMRLYPTGLRAGREYLMFASGTNSGGAYIQFNAPLAPGKAITFQVEILSTDNRPPTNTFRVEATVATPPVPVSGNDIVITRSFKENVLGVDRPVLEFTSVPGKIYAVIYSDDSGMTWKTAAPFITATSTVVQWVDSGPPKTDPLPLTVRLYRVVLWQ